MEVNTQALSSEPKSAHAARQKAHNLSIITIDEDTEDGTNADWIIGPAPQLTAANEKRNMF